MPWAVTECGRRGATGARTGSFNVVVTRSSFGSRGSLEGNMGSIRPISSRFRGSGCAVNAKVKAFRCDANDRFGSSRSIVGTSIRKPVGGQAGENISTPATFASDTWRVNGALVPYPRAGIGAEHRDPVHRHHHGEGDDQHGDSEHR